MKTQKKEEEEVRKEIRQVTQFQFYVRHTLRCESVCECVCAITTDTIGKNDPYLSNGKIACKQTDTCKHNNMMQWEQSECQ